MLLVYLTGFKSAKNICITSFTCYNVNVSIGSNISNFETESQLNENHFDM